MNNKCPEKSGKHVNDCGGEQSAVCDYCGTFIIDPDPSKKKSRKQFKEKKG